MAPSWILIVFGIIIGFKGVFYLITPKYSRRIIINLLKLMSDKALRILALVLIILSVLLIIWAVI